MFSLMVGSSPHVVQRVDESVSSWVRSQDVFDVLRFLDPWGSTGVSLVLAVVIGLAALRCRPGAIIFAGSIVAAIVLHVTLRSVVERPRPDATEMLTSSFPSGHVLQAAALAGLLPLAARGDHGPATAGHHRWARCWSSSPSPARSIACTWGRTGHPTSSAAVSSAWPSRSGAGGASSTAAGTRGAAAVSGHRPATSRGDAARCPSQPHRLLTIRRLAHLSARCAALGLAVLTLTVGVPENPDGTVFGPEIATPAQLVLAGLVSVGALVAWRWDAVGAVLIASPLRDSGCSPPSSTPRRSPLGMTVVLFLPALLLWLGWQHERTWGEIVGLAAVHHRPARRDRRRRHQVYDSFYGPTHPDSTAVDLPVDGGVGVDRRAAERRRSRSWQARRRRGRDGRSTVLFSPRPVPPWSSTRWSPTSTASCGRRATGLRPATNYRFTVVVDGEPDATRGAGSFRTPGVGAESFRVALSSCARVGSNARVFDAIAAADPLVYLQMGDLHYANIGRNSPDAFRSAYDTLLTEPGQAALYRQVPIAYVWDDHDYGPNDADSTSASRPAARQVYREVVPHAGRPARRRADQPGVHDRPGALRDDRQPLGTHGRLDARRGPSSPGCSTS
jgi:hypothetical protein